MKVSRNDPCPCGSGKKYKKCCLAKDDAREQEVLAAARSQAEEWDLDAPSIGAAESWAEEEPGAKTMESATHERPTEPQLREYPRVNESLPPLSPDDERLVEEWWKQAEPDLNKRHADSMLRRLETFLECHPQLFVHLDLHMGYVFELGAELARRGQWPVYIALLRRLRREQPRMYSFSFGYYDFGIVADLAVSGSAEGMSEFFSFWKEYPDSAPDKCHELISLLAWLGFEGPLYELAEAVAVPMLTSREVVGGNFAMDWLILREYIASLEKGEASEAAGAELDANLTRLGERLGYPLSLQPRSSRHALELTLAPLETMDSAAFRHLGPAFNNDLGWRFTGYLRRERGLNWLSARSAGNRLEDYLYWCGDRKRSPLRFKSQEIEECVVQTSKRMLWLNDVRAASLLQSLAWFADFLKVASLLTEVGRVQATEVCDRLFRKVRDVVAADAPAFRRYGSFEALINTHRGGSGSVSAA